MKIFNLISALNYETDNKTMTVYLYGNYIFDTSNKELFEKLNDKIILLDKLDVKPMILCNHKVRSGWIIDDLIDRIVILATSDSMDELEKQLYNNRFLSKYVVINTHEVTQPMKELVKKYDYVLIENNHILNKKTIKKFNMPIEEHLSIALNIEINESDCIDLINNAKSLGYNFTSLTEKEKLTKHVSFNNVNSKEDNNVDLKEDNNNVDLKEDNNSVNDSNEEDSFIKENSCKSIFFNLFYLLLL
ncbi:hypothetical protein A0H76_662 [Hepatospora eriocheir]|uniref:Uncharacterized protein n=1 Tax=Hepatospora eriocheir TaxID=1081669 RepID=A0A1X0QL29_9MICR|nr:hypothetical protein A0H76_662 [Hepatospora eriocheir]